MVEQWDRGDRLTDGFGHDHEIGQRCAAAADLDGTAHTRCAEFDDLVPQAPVESERFGGASHRWRRFIREEPIEQFSDGFLVGTQSQIDTHGWLRRGAAGFGAIDSLAHRSGRHRIDPAVAHSVGQRRVSLSPTAPCLSQSDSAVSLSVGQRRVLGPAVIGLARG